jgi:hypothetical protein
MSERMTAPTTAFSSRPQERITGRIRHWYLKTTSLLRHSGVSSWLRKLKPVEGRLRPP